MAARYLAFAGALAMVLAGCLDGDSAGKASQGVRIQAERVAIEEYLANRPVFSLEKIMPFVATTGDGIKLKGHVYLPNASGPVPTVLEYSPYWNTQQQASDAHTQTIDGRLTMTGRHQHFLDAGYAVALVNIRGTGVSTGCFQWGAETDLEDAYLVVETLAHMPHSDGMVGMIGLSYPGWTQYMALGAAPPSLKAVIPVSGVIDLHSLLTRNGAPLMAGSGVTTLWNSQYSLGEATYPPIDSRGGEAAHTECGPRYAEDLAEGIGLQTTGDRNAYWEARDLRPFLAESRVPMLFTNGMTTGEGHILQFEGLWDLIPHAEKRMLIGQWPHAYPQAPPQDFWEMAVAWFEHYLLGGPKLLETGVVEYEDNQRNWHTATQWPPPHVDAELFLSADALVPDRSGVKASAQSFQSAYRDPSLSECAPAPVQAAYVSPPLAEDVRLAGNFFVELTVTSSLPDGNLVAFLFATPGDGSCPDEGVREVRRALTDLRHPTPGARGADFPLNAPTALEIRSHPFSDSLRAGERLVLVVAGEAEELQPDPREPVLTVSTGPSLSGSLRLPVVEGRLVFE